MRRHEIFKRFAMLVAGLMLTAGITAVSASGVAGLSDDSARSGALHVTKMCAPPPAGGFTGQPGSYCTITSSTLMAIGVGSKVFYAEGPAAGVLDSDIYLYTGPGSSAFGHVTLSLATRSGVIKFSGGTGQFRGFRAWVDVTYNADTNLWHWDGRYGFTRPNDDD